MVEIIRAIRSPIITILGEMETTQVVEVVEDHLAVVDHPEIIRATAATITGITPRRLVLEIILITRLCPHR